MGVTLAIRHSSSEQYNRGGSCFAEMMMVRLSLRVHVVLAGASLLFCVVPSSALAPREVCNMVQHLDFLYALMEKRTSLGLAI